MKNPLKKLTAAVMAFTLLGAGTSFTKALSPQSDNTLTASATSLAPPPFKIVITCKSQWVTATIEIIHWYANGVEIGTQTIYHG